VALEVAGSIPVARPSPFPDSRSEPTGRVAASILLATGSPEATGGQLTGNGGDAAPYATPFSGIQGPFPGIQGPSPGIQGPFPGILWYAIGHPVVCDGFGAVGKARARKA
jgi:hypothetical protein